MVRVALRGARTQVRDDLRTDPYLRYILALAALLAVFWIWHRVPNFATRDERWRVLDPIRPVGFLVEDFRPGSVREGLTVWRSYGGTFYVYGLVVLPVVAVLLATGQGSVLTEMSNYTVRNLWNGWQGVPAWVWTATVLPARLVNVAFAVGSVYVVYRLGVTVRDRATGRLAALLTSLTWGLVVLAHEAGEDVPALFFFLLAVYYAVEYVDTGARRTFYLGCLCGGLATGFKFTAGASAFLLGVAHATWAYRSDEPWVEAVRKPRILATGMAIGAVLIFASYPQVFVGAVDRFGGRIERGVRGKSSPHSWIQASSWWWIVRGYLHGQGLPLAVASGGGILAALGWVHERSRVGVFSLLLLVTMGTLLLVYSLWGYVRTHHLLLTFPLLAVLVAVGLARYGERQPGVARLLVAVLVLSTGAYAVAGDLGYAAQGRDDADAWLRSHAQPNATVETYVRDPQEAGVPHRFAVDNPGPTDKVLRMPERCPDYIVLNFHGALTYLAPDTHSRRAAILDDPRMTEYVRELLSEETYPYEVVGRFGRRPAFLGGHSPGTGLLGAGLRPRTIQYGDPQDLGVYQYTVVLERAGPCDG